MKDGNETAALIKKEVYRILEEEEGITQEGLCMVDLDIAYSPVIPQKNGDPCEAIKTMGGKYLVQHPLCSDAVSKEILTVMRYRYLTSYRR